MRSIRVLASLAFLCSGCLQPATCVELLSCPVEDSDASTQPSGDGGVESSTDQSLDSASSGTASNTTLSRGTESAADAEATTEPALEAGNHSTDPPRHNAEAGTCGDGVFGDGEVCDDGNNHDEATCLYGQATCITCNATCTEALELTGPTCGDGLVSNGEACDEEATWCKRCRVVPAVAAGGQHTCALQSGGGVKCWGQGVAGRLGNGLDDDQKTPVDVTGLTSGVRAVVAGSLHSCALTMTGGVKCWGDGSYGQVGDGTTTTRRTPVDVAGLEGGVVALAAGNLHTCALLANGNVRCWGHGASGALGNGDTSVEPAPVSVLDLTDVEAISAGGGSHTCAQTSTGQVSCWGAGTSGQLGDGGSDNQSTPVEVAGLDGQVARLAVGGQHTCALLDSGHVQCWGFGEAGQLGDGLDQNQSTPVSVAGIDDAIFLTAGGYHTCAVIGSDSHVVCWGKGDTGQLGSGGTDSQLQPEPVSDLSAALALGAGGQHTCALLDNESLACWGRGDNGQLGTGKAVNELSPAAVLGIP